MQIWLSYSQAEPGRRAKQGQEEISRNHIQTLNLGSVHVKKSAYSLYRHGTRAKCKICHRV